MKDSLTDITIVLDRSGSMSSVATDTIGGFNSFLADQKKAPGDALISLVQFDNEYTPVYMGQPIAEAPELTDKTFVPRGATALLDAIGRTIAATGARFSAMAEADRPGKVIFVVITDGAENSSQEFTRDAVFKLITHQRENYKWEFVFMGANQDAISTGSAMGIAASNSLSYAANAVGTRSSYGSMGSNITSMRAGTAKTAAFSQDQRDAQKAAGLSH